MARRDDVPLDRGARRGDRQPEVPGTAAVSGATTVVGVIGDPVAHSLSPRLHNSAFGAMGLDWVSVGFAVASGSGPAALVGIRALGIRGLSVTMPHKEAVVALVDRLTPAALRVGAVNCVSNDGGVLEGDNTDGAGFVASLRNEAGFDPRGRACLVIGAGGAARAVIAGLADAGASEVVVVNRSRDRAEVAASVAGPVGRVGTREDVRACALVVNATPVGMAGVGNGGGDGAGVGHGGDGMAGLPMPGAGQLAVDLVYHPVSTPWLEEARRTGATGMNGLGMLVHQAALQIERWTGRPAPVAAMRRAVFPPPPG